MTSRVNADEGTDDSDDGDEEEEEVVAEEVRIDTCAFTIYVYLI